MTNSAFEELIEVIRDHRDDGFEVPAVRMGKDTYMELLTGREFIRRNSDGFDFELEYSEAVGMAAGTEIIVDGKISGVVAEDVRGMWRND